MFIAIVLAGERGEKNNLLEYAKVKSKSLIEIKNKPMILHVLEALLQSSFFEEILIVGPTLIIDECEQIKKFIETKKVKFYEQKTSPAESLLSIFKEVNINKKIFITTSDNALLKIDWVNYFCQRALDSGKDILMAVNDYNSVKKKYPESKRTVLKFKGAAYCFCNLFAVMNEDGRSVVNIWRKVEVLRKKPLKIAKMFMPLWGLILFLMGILTSDIAFKIMSKRINAKASIINLPYPEACIDVDKIDDLILVKKILK
jgi:GTP:adenosylcobinamide-phosphate guanylyltransferase